MPTNASKSVSLPPQASNLPASEMTAHSGVISGMERPHVPPMTATWPSRWIEVNGFRYVLDEKEQGR